jgi:hypothetical protein
MDAARTLVRVITQGDTPERFVATLAERPTQEEGARYSGAFRTFTRAPTHQFPDLADYATGTKRAAAAPHRPYLLQT